MYKCALILAAGQGTRIKSDLPKVLHKVCGKEMVNHVIDTLRKAKIEDVNVIVGKGAELVKEKTNSRNVSYSLQTEQLGTGHAVKSAIEFLSGKKGTVAVFCGDAPLITEETIGRLFNEHINNENSTTLLTSILDDATGYGRIIRDGEEVLKIVEHKDCNEEELKVNEMNAGVYCFDIENLLNSLEKLSNNNAQGEYYLTDVIGIQKSEGKNVGAVVVDYEETIGVNSRRQLAEVEEILRNRINNRHMDNGVTLINPSVTYIGADVEIGKDTIIYPGNTIEGVSKIGSGCIIYPNSRINNSVIEDNVQVESSVIIDSKIGSYTTVGPFAYIRPESIIGALVDMLASGQLAKFFYARLHIVARHAFACVNGGKVHLVFHPFIGLNHPVRNIQPQILLGFHHGNPEFAFQNDAALCGPDGFHGGGGVPFSQDIGNHAHIKMCICGGYQKR